MTTFSLTKNLAWKSNVDLYSFISTVTTTMIFIWERQQKFSDHDLMLNLFVTSDWLSFHWQCLSSFGSLLTCGSWDIIWDLVTIRNKGGCSWQHHYFFIRSRSCHQTFSTQYSTDNHSYYTLDLLGKLV